MIGERLSDRYELLSELGRGGMGVVYRARDPLLERDVAVKVISLAQITPEAEQRFRREAQLVGQMDHPGIVPIFDLGAHQDVLFFVMPVVDGTTLQTLVRQRALVLEDTLEIVTQVAEALDYSHSRGVVHRDIKPENVMVTRENGQPRARVMDFGLALVGAASRLTKTGKLPGTLIYLSPEQILSAEIDGRSDLYSLGTILYECLTGGPPFSGSRYSLLYRIAHEAPPPLDAYGIDERLSAIVTSCLAKDPAARPQRGGVLAEQVRRYRSELDQEHRRRTVAERARGGAETPGVTPLAGRVRETAELRRRLEEAFAGGCRLVTVGGEAGMGKTRLLRYVEEVARSRGDAVVLRGRFSAEDAFPYQGFGELFRDYFRGREPSSRSVGEPDLRDLAADLVELFPALGEIPAVRAAALSAAGPALSVSQAARDHTRIFELLARTLTRLAAERPLLLLLEQLHASEAPAEALQYVLRRLGPTPTLIVATYRPSEIDRRHPLPRMLRGFKDDPRLTSIVLEPLTESEHRELLATLLAGSSMSDELVAKLYSASEGNPFFIQEWVRWLLETGDLWRDDEGTWRLSSESAVSRDAMPETIQQAIESRLEELPEARLEVLRTASILGPSFDFVDLQALAAGDVEREVDELIRDGLLEEDPRSRDDRLIFSSRLVRKTLYRGLPRRRRRLLHRRHAGFLEARFAGRPQRVYARLVHHFAEGDVPDRTIRYALDLAREALEGFGWEAAIRATRTALELVEDEAAAGDVAGELRRLLAAALAAEGQHEAALKEAGRAFATSERAGLPGEAAEAALLAAEMSWQGRKVEETRKWVARGTELARRAEVRDCHRKLLTLGATLANLGGEYDKAKALREEAETLAEVERADTAEAPVPAGGTLVVSLANPLRRKDLQASFTAEETEVFSNVYETLLKSDVDGNLVPTLCREWEGSARGRLFRFALRGEVRFSDGTPLAAADVKRSFEAAARRGGDLPAPAFRALRGIEELIAGSAEGLAGIRLEGDEVVEFHLRSPLPIFPALLTDPRTAVVREIEGGPPHLGTGPFRVPPGDAWFQEGRVMLERNPDDWRKRPAPLAGIEFRVMPHAYETARALRAGEVDLARDLAAEDFEEVLRDPRFRSGLVEAIQKNVFYVLLNGSGPLARRAEVRRALVGVVRVQDVVWRTLGRQAQPASGLMPPGILGYDPGRRRAVLGRDEARSLLASAGLEPPLELRGAVHPRLLDRYGPLIRALVEEWTALGCEIDLATLPPDSYLSRAADASGIDFCFGRWDFAYDDPDNIAFEMLHSRLGLVAPYLVSDAADPATERGRQEVRAAHRQRLYRRFESLLAEQAVLLPLAHDVRHGVSGPRVRNLRLLSSPPFVNYAEVGKVAEGDERPRHRLRGLRQSGTLHVPLAGIVAGLGPENAFTAEASEALPNVFETLTSIDEGAHVVPHLASEFRLEDGGRRYRFRLRHNVRFHDGRRLSVRDVRHSFERLLTSSRSGAETPLLPIVGARALRAGEASELAGLRVVSERELVLELERPLSFFPAMLTSPATAIVPEGSDRFDSNWRQGVAGTGPFRVVRFVAGERLELAANPHYWKSGFPRCDRLIFELGLTSERIAADFRAGALALASHLRPADLESLRRAGELAAGYREAPGFSTYYLALNSHRGTFADLERRRALVELLDAGGAVRETLGRVAVAARGLIPPGLPGQAGDVDEVPAAGSRAAASLLAGLELRCAVHPAYRDTYDGFWRRLTEPLAACGVELKVVVLDPGARPAAGDDLDLFASRWLADYPDSDTFAHLLHSTEGVGGALAGDPEIDRCIERGRAETDPALRHAIYRELERRACDRALVVPLFHETVYRFVRPEIQGLRLRMRSPFVAYEELGLGP